MRLVERDEKHKNKQLRIPKKVTIIKAISEFCWYKKYIGKTYNVVGMDDYSMLYKIEKQTNYKIKNRNEIKEKQYLYILKYDCYEIY